MGRLGGWGVAYHETKYALVVNFSKGMNTANNQNRSYLLATQEFTIVSSHSSRKGVYHVILYDCYNLCCFVLLGSLNAL